METKDWVTIISVAIVIVGWFINSMLNRRHEIFKERFKYQMVARQSFIDVWFFIQKNSAPYTTPEFLPLLENARKNFLLYATNKEIRLLESFIKSSEQNNLEESVQALNELVILMPKIIRKELKIESN